MNAHSHSHAVAGLTSHHRSKLPRQQPMHRSRSACQFDLTHEKEREACRKVSYAQWGDDLQGHRLSAHCRRGVCFASQRRTLYGQEGCSD